MLKDNVLGGFFTNKPFLSKKRNVCIIAVLYTFLWGCAFPLVKLCMQNFSVAGNDNLSKCLVAGIRFSFAGLLTLLIARLIFRQSLKIKAKQFKTCFVYGVTATAMQYAFTYIGLSMVDASKGAVYDQLCVFFIVLCSGIFFKDDKLSLKKIIGCIVGFLGVAAINVSSLSFSLSLGDIIMVGAALVQTVAYFVAKKSTTDFSPVLLVGYGQLSGGLLLTVGSLVFGGRIVTVNNEAILSLTALIFIASIAYILSLLPLKYFRASEISIFNLLITIFGVVMSGIVLKENVLKLNYAIALILIIVAVLIINSKEKKYVE